MGSLGMGELVVVLLMLVLIFGAKRLPQIGEGFGKAIRGFKRGISGDDEQPEDPKRISQQSSAGAALPKDESQVPDPNKHS